MILRYIDSLNYKYILCEIYIYSLNIQIYVLWNCHKPFKRCCLAIYFLLLLFASCWLDCQFCFYAEPDHFKLIFCSIQLVAEVTSQWLRSQLSGPEFLLSSWHSGKSCSTFSFLHYMFSPAVHAPSSILPVQMKLCGRHIQIHACVYYTDIALLWGKQWCFIPSCLKWGSHY